MVMIAMLKGKPLINIEGDRAITPRNPQRSLPNIPLKSAMRTAPTTVVVTHVAANKSTFNQGNGRADSSTKTSAKRVNILSIKCFDAQLQRLQVFAKLKPHC